MSAPRGYWSEVFFQACQLMKQRPDIGGEAAFWAARAIVDQSRDSLPMPADKAPPELELE